ncbi:sensor histidine kinase [Sinomonas flava]|uniref:sensor histidine kinase n=1 Tax=Sinomonas flava TaxID=496857 RepID=UPI0039A67836
MFSRSSPPATAAQTPQPSPDPPATPAERVLRWLPTALQVAFALLLLIGTVRALAPAPDAAGAAPGIVLPLVGLLAATYGAGIVLQKRPAKGLPFDPAQYRLHWLAGMCALWAVLVAVSAEFVWVAIPLFFVQLQLPLPPQPADERVPGSQPAPREQPAAAPEPAAVDEPAPAVPSSAPPAASRRAEPEPKPPRGAPVRQPATQRQDPRLAESLRTLCERTTAASAARGTGLTCRFDLEGTSRPLPDAAEDAFLKAAQASLANVWQHAQASTAVVCLAYLEDEVTLEVRDDGAGFEPTDAATGAARENGLRVLRERVEEAGAAMAVASAPGEGTRVTVSVSTPGTPTADSD